MTKMETEKLAPELYLEHITRMTYRIWYNRKHLDTVSGQREKVLRKVWTVVINIHANKDSIHKLYLDVFKERCKHDLSYRWQLLEVLEKIGYEATAKLLMKGK